MRDSADLELRPPRVVLPVRLASVNVRLDIPRDVWAPADAMLRGARRVATSVEPDIVVSAERRDDAWQIRGFGGAVKLLEPAAALPHVAGALISLTVAGIAALRGLTSVRATVVEKDGRALALIGDDWESAITLAVHLHARGWSFVGSDVMLLDPRTLDVFAVQKSLHVNSSAIAQFPAGYRRALEASPWYVTPQGISFYAVDPRDAGLRHAWAPGARLTAVAIVDGEMASSAALESPDRQRLDGERFGRLGIDWTRVTTVDLRLGGCVQTCDLVDFWFRSIVAT